jgi:hypothetical protein
MGTVLLFVVMHIAFENRLGKCTTDSTILEIHYSKHADKYFCLSRGMFFQSFS